jgi:FkbM family methyltransferase
MGIKLKQILKNDIRKLLASRGYVVAKREAPPHKMDDAFHSIFNRRHSFNTVIDVGASTGSWSAAFMEYFPNCQYLLIEAQPIHEKALIQFCHEHGNAQMVLAAAGEYQGQIYFNAKDPLGGQASYTPYVSDNIQIPVITIDNEISSRKLPGPYMIKMDTHGFEVPILNGASRILAETDVIIMECYNFRIAPECLLFYEMCDYMERFGFRCIDLVDPFNRPYDDSFWQMDLVFVKDNRPEFLYLDYR